MFVHEVTVEECRKVLVKAGFGRLACARENQPYVVPVYFAFDGDYVYLSSMLGQKIEWMRNNPRICLEVDNMESFDNWTSIVVFGQYEELPDTPDYHFQRLRAYSLLQNRPMWWQPGSVVVANHEARRDSAPVFYRIKIERVTGRRGVPAPGETGMARAIPEDHKGGWLRQLLSRSASKR